MLISYAVTVQLICLFVFAYAKIRFSHDAFALEDGSKRVCFAGLTETEVKDETSLMQVGNKLFKSNDARFSVT